MNGLFRTLDNQLELVVELERVLAQTCAEYRVAKGLSKVNILTVLPSTLDRVALNTCGMSKAELLDYHKAIYEAAQVLYKEV